MTAVAHDLVLQRVALALGVFVNHLGWHHLAVIRNRAVRDHPLDVQLHAVVILRRRGT
ncbi:hypothetical protein D3C86_2251940 [compost metagenome]